MVEIYYNRGTEKVEKIGNITDIFGVKSCKSYRSYLENRIIYFRKQGLTETEVILEGLLKAYNHFHPIQTAQVEVEGWHGKSSLEIIKKLNGLTIIKYQRKDKESEPKEIRTEVTKEELISLIEAIKSLQTRLIDRDYLETKEIAFQYCINMNIRKDPKGRLMLNEDFWILFFGWRSLHCKMALMLAALEKLNLISYTGGKIRLLNKNISIQLVL